MIAESIKPLSALSDRNTNSRNRVNSISNAENGPTPVPTMVIANDEINATSSVEIRAPKRSAAQPMIGKKMNATGTSRVEKMLHRPNINCEPRKTATNSAIASPKRAQVHRISRP